MHNDKRCRTHSIRFRFSARIFFLIFWSWLNYDDREQCKCFVWFLINDNRISKWLKWLFVSLHRCRKKLFSFFYTLFNVDGLTTWMGELGTDFTVVSTGPENFLLEGTGTEKLSSLFQHLRLVGPLAISLVNNKKKVFSFSPFRVYTQTMF